MKVLIFNKPLIACVLALLSCVVVVTKAGSTTAGTQAIVKTIHVAAPGKDDSRYLYVPFQVPAGARRISIGYGYDRANGTNALDIGLLDSHKREVQNELEGFRGWSGGRRSDVFLSRKEATPGYVPGELPAGTWRIILGLYRVVPEGVDVTFKINIETDENQSQEPVVAPAASSLSVRLSSLPDTGGPVAASAARSKPTRGSQRWIAGDLHLHTVHSDGDWTIAGLVDAGRAAGLDFICVTDHNTNSHHAEIDRLSTDALLVVRGEEITTYGGHANAWGLPANTLIDFRVRPGDREGMSRIASQVHRLGALISINHPFAACVGCDWSYDPAAPDFDAIEVWNGVWDPTDEQALALWDRLLQKGRRITAVASSDSHRSSSPIGYPTTHLLISGPLDKETILEAIRAGRAYLTSEPKHPAIRFVVQDREDNSSKSMGETVMLARPQRLRFIIGVDLLMPEATVSLISHGQPLRTFAITADNAPKSVEVDCESPGYFRVEIRNKAGAMLALTNPIYIEMKKRRATSTKH